MLDATQDQEEKKVRKLDVDILNLMGSSSDDQGEDDNSDDLDLTGSSDDDDLEGDNKSNLINGRKGDDVISAARGNDDVLGGEGDDIIDAGNGKDSVFGGTGNDALDGGRGKDFLVGAAGVSTGVTTEFDTLTGGSSKDAFVVGAWGSYTAGGDSDYADVKDFGKKDTLWLASDAILGAKDALGLTTDDTKAISDRANFDIIEGRNVKNIGDLTNGLYTLGAAPTGDGSAGVYLNQDGAAPELVAVLRGVSAPTPVEQPTDQPVV